MTPERCRAPGGVLLGVVLVVGLASAAGGEEVDWRALLRGAAESAGEVAYTGEALWITDVAGTSHVARVRVRNGDDGMVIDSPGHLSLRLPPRGVEIVGPGRSRHLSVAAADRGLGDQLDRLADKYEVEVGVGERFLDRPCTTVVIRRRGDGRVRERLWLDDDSGLVLRRETFEDGPEPVRLATYLSLDLRRRPVAGRVTRGGGPATSREGLEPVEEAGLHALRQAGWVVPDALPGGYELLGSYAVDTAESQPLQAVYGDGLYLVSVFQQPGRPDWEALPDGMAPVEGLSFPAYEWPGAVPRRILWEADGRTWSLVGDAPPEEMESIAGALPQPERRGTWERLRRGLGRMWRAMSPWEA